MSVVRIGTQRTGLYTADGCGLVSRAGTPRWNRADCATTLATQFSATRRIQAVQLPYRQACDFCTGLGGTGWPCMHACRQISVSPCMRACWLKGNVSHVRSSFDHVRVSIRRMAMARARGRRSATVIAGSAQLASIGCGDRGYMIIQHCMQQQ